MHWMAQKPTTPGWYWWRYYRGAIEYVLEVSQTTSNDTPRLYVSALTGFLVDQSGEWSSCPVPRPEELREP